MKYKVRDTFFLGKKANPRQPVRVIGAGIAGLLTGFHLKKAGYDFEIIEKSDRAGGLLGTRSLAGRSGRASCQRLHLVPAHAKPGG